VKGNRFLLEWGGGKGEKLLQGKGGNKGGAGVGGSRGGNCIAGIRVTKGWFLKGKTRSPLQKKWGFKTIAGTRGKTTFRKAPAVEGEDR